MIGTPAAAMIALLVLLIPISLIADAGGPEEISYCYRNHLYMVELEYLPMKITPSL